jgi:acetyltransferase-like isoleucine patch superfamily enzyme
VLQYGVRVGDNAILWSGNHVGHQTVIGDHCFISSHVVISGFCKIGSACFLGVNSCFGDKVTVAPDCVVGAGAVVVKDTEPRRVYVGNPAKPLEHDSFKTFGVQEAG